MTEQKIQQALVNAVATMERQRLLKQLWKLRKLSAEASSESTEGPAGREFRPSGRQKRSA
jgi:hypothetical protein